MGTDTGSSVRAAASVAAERRRSQREQRQHRGFAIMGSKAWGLVMFTLLASALPVHALIISARRGRADVKARIARDKRDDHADARDGQD